MKGDIMGIRKLSDTEVAYMRKLYSNKVSIAEIARIYSVHAATVKAAIENPERGNADSKAPKLKPSTIASRQEDELLRFQAELQVEKDLAYEYYLQHPELWTEGERQLAKEIDELEEPGASELV